jgi:hypothetical protein
MSALVIALTVLGCTLAAALAGIGLRARLPEAHLDGDSRDVVKGVMGLIATMAALVLGLLIASALSSYNAQNTDLRKLAADILQQDRYLAMYGAETEDLRDQLRQLVATAHDQIWSPTGVKVEYLTSDKIRDQTARFLTTLARVVLIRDSAHVGPPHMGEGGCWPWMMLTSHAPKRSIRSRLVAIHSGVSPLGR